MKEQYKVMRNIISEELAEFLGLYFLNLPNFSKGNLSDHQTMNTPSYDSEAITETLLVMILKRLEEESGLELHPTYSYLRVYKKGDELPFHTDRPACEISCTINLKQSHPWPIHMDGEELILHPGDGCIYKGMEVNHGRYEFEGDYCVQVFCHYVNEHLDHIDDKKLKPGKPRFITNLG
jgi:hypothetical protein|tara:strand:- start:1268 stop:1804 length:537 start_codon:yes stop_codon:yes gene_type:complete